MREGELGGGQKRFKHPAPPAGAFSLQTCLGATSARLGPTLIPPPPPPGASLPPAGPGLSPCSSARVAAAPPLPGQGVRRSGAGRGVARAQPGLEAGGPGCPGPGRGSRGRARAVVPSGCCTFPGGRHSPVSWS